MSTDQTRHNSAVRPRGKSFAVGARHRIADDAVNELERAIGMPLTARQRLAVRKVMRDALTKLVGVARLGGLPND